MAILIQNICHTKVSMTVQLTSNAIIEKVITPWAGILFKTQFILQSLG